jgi:hypothetical protein
VANQANIESIPAEGIATLETEIKAIDDENKLVAADVKALTNGSFSILFSHRLSNFLRRLELSKLKSSPTDTELGVQMEQTQVQVRLVLFCSSLFTSTAFICFRVIQDIRKTQTFDPTPSGDTSHFSYGSRGARGGLDQMAF